MSRCVVPGLPPAPGGRVARDHDDIARVRSGAGGGQEGGADGSAAAAAVYVEFVAQFRAGVEESMALVEQEVPGREGGTVGARCWVGGRGAE